MANALDLFSLNPGITLGEHYQAVSAAYTTKVVDKILGANSTSAAFTITLATASCWAGNTISVKDEGGLAGTHNITVQGEGAESIDGSSTFVLNIDKQFQGFYSNGTNWQLM